MVRERDQLVTASSYELTIDGVEQGPFTMVSGFHIQMQLTTATHSGALGGEHEIDMAPGEVMWPTLQLSRPFFADDLGMYDWFVESQKGETAERAVKGGSLVALDSRKAPLITFNFEDAFISSWGLSAFNASDSSAVEEMMTLVVHRIAKA